VPAPVPAFVRACVGTKRMAVVFSSVSKLTVWLLLACAAISLAPARMYQLTAEGGNESGGAGDAGTDPAAPAVGGSVGLGSLLPKPAYDIVRDGFRSADAGDWFDEVATPTEELDIDEVVEARPPVVAVAGADAGPLPVAPSEASAGVCGRPCTV
jgi:hypothetical protein